MLKPATLDLTNPAILEELWQSATFDKSVFGLLEQLTKAQEAGALNLDNQVIKKLREDVYHHLTTTRNRNLITNDQQSVLRKAVGGFFGMSTGSHSAVTWIMESRADAIKLIDPDHVSPSNLNRMKYGWDAVGKNKIDVVEAEINAISPYTKVYKSLDTNPESQETIVSQTPRLDFIVEAVDDLPAKFHLRAFAKKYRIPLIMATDVGDNVFLDIERYDLDPQPEFFNGRVKKINTPDLSQITMQERIQISMDIVGFEHNSLAMLESLLSIGKKISTWPQLASTAVLTGGSVTAAIKKILLGELVKSGRYYLSLDELLVKDFNSQEKKAERADIVEKINKRFGKK